MSWVNGLPTQVVHFETDESPTQITAFYRAFWGQKRGEAVRESRHAEWQLLAHVQGPFQTVVQVQPRGGTGSRVIVSRVNFIEAKRSIFPKDWSVPPGLRVHQVMESFDVHQRSYYITAQAERSPSWLCEHLPSFWQRKGWRIGGKVHEDKACVMNLVRSSAQLEVLIRSPEVAVSQLSFVVMQWVEEATHEKQ